MKEASKYHPAWRKDSLGTVLVSSTGFKFEVDDSYEPFEVGWGEVSAVKKRTSNFEMRLVLQDGKSYTFRFADQKTIECVQAESKRQWKGQFQQSLAFIEVADLTESLSSSIHEVDSTVSMTPSARIQAATADGKTKAARSVQSPKTLLDSAKSKPVTPPVTQVVQVISPSPSPASTLAPNRLVTSSTAAPTPAPVPSPVPSSTATAAPIPAPALSHPGKGLNSPATLAPMPPATQMPAPTSAPAPVASHQLRKGLNSMGPLLYEMKDGEAKSSGTASSKGPEKLSILQFYEHVVVLRHNNLPDGYEMEVIPRFKIVGARISRRATGGPPGGCLGCCFRCWVPSCLVPMIYPSETKYFLSLEVRHNNQDTSYSLENPFADIEGTHSKETTAIVFPSEKELDEEFLIQYVYGVLQTNDRNSEAHMMSHFTTAATATNASYSGVGSLVLNAMTKP